MTRETLPNRRYSESFDFGHLGIRYSGQVGFFSDGSIGDVFLGMEKAAGTAMDVVARDAAVLISLGLQNGVEVERMLHSVTKDEYGAPEGVIGSLLAFLADYQPKPAPSSAHTEVPTEVSLEANKAGVSARDQARGMGFTGNQCTACGSMQMKVSGHCEVCSECGTTTGCS